MRRPCCKDSWRASGAPAATAMAACSGSSSRLHAERNPDFAVHYQAFITAHHRHVARVFAAMFEKAGKEPPAAPEALAAAALSFGTSLALQSGHGAQRGNPAYAGDMFLLYLRGLLAVAGPARASRPTSPHGPQTSLKRSPT